MNFETGSSTITAESMPQIRNIAAILKAFPNASIKIGGYTDATGDETAEGYGSKFAKAPANASDEERRMDRRISLSVRKK